MQQQNRVRSNEAQEFIVGCELVDEELAGIFGGAGSTPVINGGDPNSLGNAGTSPAPGGVLSGLLGGSNSNGLLGNLFGNSGSNAGENAPSLFNLLGGFTGL